MILLSVNMAKADEPTDSEFYRAGNYVYISGQVATDPQTGNIVSNNFKEQLDQVLKNLKAVAEKAGGSLQNIIKLNVYMTDIDKNYPIMTSTIPKYFSPPYPARTPIGAIVGEGMLVEIDAVMYLP